MRPLPTIPAYRPSRAAPKLQKPAKHLDHAKNEVVAARYFDIPAEAIEAAAQRR